MIFILGPIAVGKMTVGQHLAERLGYPMMHNHHSIELALQFFDFGTAGFSKISEGIREVIFDTISSTEEVNGFIFSLVLSFDIPEEWDYLDAFKQRLGSDKWDFYFVELYAPLGVRLERNKTANRLKHKESKRKIEQSESHLKILDNEWVMNSRDGDVTEENYIIIDNTDKAPNEVVDIILDEFKIK